MCGVTVRDRVAGKELYTRLDIDSISSTATRSTLRWNGHVQRWYDTYLVKRCTECEVSAIVGKGRDRTAWKECVKNEFENIEF